MARARAAIASRLASTAASMTTSKEAQEIERRLEKVARPTTPGGRPGAAAGPPEAGLDPAMLRELVEIDRALATLEVPADEWETLYRIRLQVERDLEPGTPSATRSRATRVPASRSLDRRPRGMGRTWTIGSRSERL